MNKIFNRNKVLRLIGILILFIITFVLVNKKTYLAIDDSIYKTSFSNFTGWKNWASEYYAIWSGRVLIHTIITFLLNSNLIIYKCINTINIMLLAYTIYKITNISEKENKKEQFVIFVFIFEIFYLINKGVLDNAVYWLTGSFNYLLPSMCLCISLIPFIKEFKEIKIKNFEYIFYIIASIIASSADQTAAVLMCFSVILIISKKFKVKKLTLLQLLIIIVISLITLLAPGNSVRNAAETVTWYYNLDMLSFGDKILQGTSLMLNHLFIDSKILMLILSVLILLNFAKSKQKTIDKCIIAIPSVYMMLDVLPLNVILSRIPDFVDVENKLNKYLYNYGYLGEDLILSPINYIPIISGVFVLAILAIIIFKSFENKKESFIYMLLYFAAICSSLIMGFVPTMFASSYRIFMTTDVILLIIISKIFYESKEKSSDNLQKNIMLITTCLFLIKIITYI